MIHIWVSMTACLAVIGASFAAVRLWQRRNPAASPELARKIVHITSGLVAASFPWLFDRLWPGFVLCGLSLLAMLAGRLVPSLRHSVGAVTGSVKRSSWGELLFPVAVAIVWLLARSNPLLHVVPILILTLGDAAAALVGVAVGRHKFRTAEGIKSIEGSTACIIVGALVTAASLLLLAPDLSFLKVFLIALLLAGLLAAFEAIAWRGLDNLLLPIAALPLLRIYLRLDPQDLLIRLAVFSCITLLVIARRRRMTLIGDGLLASALFLYGAWATGGWPWLTPPALLFVALRWLPRSPAVPRAVIHGVFPVLAMTGPGLTLLLLNSVGWHSDWQTYTVSFAAALAIILLVQFHARRDQRPSPVMFVSAVLVGALLIVPASAFVAGVPIVASAWLVFIAALSAAIACLLALSPRLSRLLGPANLWFLRGCALAVATSAAMAARLFFYA